MPKIIHLEDGEERLRHLALALANVTIARGTPRRWVIKQCLSTNPADALAEVRELLMQNGWNAPLIFAVDAQLSTSDHGKMSGIADVYANLMKNPGRHWRGTAFMSEHCGNRKIDPFLKMESFVKKLHGRTRPTDDVFWGTTMIQGDLELYANWANDLAKKAKIPPDRSTSVEVHRGDLDPILIDKPTVSVVGSARTRSRSR